MAPIELTGERTAPGIARENYWFRRHEAAYCWVIDRYDMAGADVVDAGSGEGYGAAMLHGAGAASVVALEYDEHAAAHSAAAYPQVATMRANLDAIPLPDASADIVVSMQVIEHLWDLGRFLRECRRVLRPRGRIVLATPNRLTFSPGLARRAKPTNPFHVEEFDADQVAGMLRAAGFADVEVLGVHHGPAIPADLVARQIDAALTDRWPQDLLAAVAGITVADFEVRAADVADSLDLIGIGRA